LGIGDWGFGVWGPTPNPQPQNPKPQIPNPQSPIPIYNHYYEYILFIKEFIIKKNKKIF
jgi:hypothetical protein